MNDFLESFIIADDTPYYHHLLKTEGIVRSDIHFASNYQQMYIKTWWRVNVVYYEDLKDILYKCDISYYFWDGMYIVGTIESDRLALSKNLDWIKLHKCINEREIV